MVCHVRAMPSVCITAVAAAVLGLFICQTAHTDNSAGEPIRVKVELIERPRAPHHIEYIGSLKAARKVKVSSEIGGIVERLYFDKGDHVFKGKILAEIGTSKVRLEVDHAAAVLKAAESMLEKAKRGSRPEEIAIAEAAFMEAAAAFKEAEEHFNRIKELHGKSSVSRSEYDAAQRLLDTARFRRQSFEQQLAMIRSGPRDEDRRLAEAQAEQARAALALAMDRLFRSFVRSPVDGIISHKNVEEGEVIIVPPGAPVAQIVDVSSLKIEFAVSELDVVFVRAGSVLEFTVDALPGITGEGEVVFVSPIGDLTHRTYSVELLVREPRGPIADGMTVRVKVPRISARTSVFIRPSAIIEKDGVLGVYIVEGGRARFREVKLGGYRGDRLEVTGGLMGGEAVVLNPSALREGAQVAF